MNSMRLHSRKFAGSESTLLPLKIPASFLEALEWKLKRLTLSFMPGQRQYSLSYTHFKLDKIKALSAPHITFVLRLVPLPRGIFLFFYILLLHYEAWNFIKPSCLIYLTSPLLPFCLPQSLIDFMRHFSFVNYLLLSAIECWKERLLLTRTQCLNRIQKPRQALHVAWLDSALQTDYCHGVLFIWKRATHEKKKPPGSINQSTGRFRK